MIMRQHNLCVVAAVLSSVVLLGTGASFAQEGSGGQPIAIGDRLELFVDRHLVDTLDGTQFYLHEPQPMPLPKSPLPIAYATVIKDGDLYRAYYRDVEPGYGGTREDGNPARLRAMRKAGTDTNGRSPTWASAR